MKKKIYKVVGRSYVTALYKKGDVVELLKLPKSWDDGFSYAEVHQKGLARQSIEARLLTEYVPKIKVGGRL